MAAVPGIDQRRRQVWARLFTLKGEMRAGLEDEPPLSSGDVALLFRMSERAIRMWAAKGELPHMRSLGGGRLLYPADQIAALYLDRYSDSSVRRPRVDGGAAVVHGDGQR